MSDLPEPTTPLKPTSRAEDEQAPCTSSGDSPSSDRIVDLPPQQRISIYVQAFEEMLDVVLRSESFLFSETELRVLSRWSALSYEARYLFVRLFIRKHVWHRASQIGYADEIADVARACHELSQPVSELPEASPGLDREVTPAPEMGTGTTYFNPIVLVSPSRTASAAIAARRRPAAPATPERVRTIESVMAGDDSFLTSGNAGEPISIDDSPQRPPSRPAPRPMQSAPSASPSTSSQAELPEWARTLGPGAKRNDDPAIVRFARDEQVLREQDDLPALLAMLSLDELKLIAKEMRISKSGTTRDSIIKALSRSATSQTTLSFLPKRSPSLETKTSGSPQLSLKFDEKGRTLCQGEIMVAKVLTRLGACIELDHTVVSLFLRVHLIFHRSSVLSSGTLTSSLLSRFKLRNYPEYQISRSFNIFKSRRSLLDYEKALLVEHKMEDCLGELSETWAQRKGTEWRTQGYIEGRRVWEAVWPAWKQMVHLAEEEDRIKLEKEDIDDRLTYYRKRFHPAWPLTRVVYKGAQILSKLKEYQLEVECLQALLAQKCFRRGKRGAWYERLALVIMNHLDDDKDRRRKQALKICLRGLEDPFTHIIYKHALQRRIMRLESLLKLDDIRKHTFNYVGLRAATRRTLEGEKLSEGETGKKSSWRAMDGAEVNVEQLSLEYYERQGFKGFHCENGILTTIFGLLFWDVLFAPVDGVFETAYQSAPLDLATDAFSIVRAGLVKERLAAIADGQAEALLSAVDDRERPRNSWCIGVRWGYTREDLLAIVRCLGGRALETICTVFAEEYGHRVGGIPDLCMWNEEQSICKFVEVKGPGDRLSETQHVWIDLLLTAGVPVELCAVVQSGEDFHDSQDDTVDESEEELPANKKRPSPLMKRKSSTDEKPVKSSKRALDRPKLKRETSAQAESKPLQARKKKDNVASSKRIKLALEDSCEVIVLD
ncbi:uncharacterized protein L969DRAFT_20070 [Mixia osmundae IAM 14324]|uniref:Fanconi-associated nuclease n=1 Tax=Mixia osmundae (strain CBS 9802 / IAM 14324 / JCM 22182 / KY 12970) TaxID=764103 RepID=G7E1L8_MIXOS|nr:uncharacterized protein L969DRAFT_20070 [Mixia osmundae IAM 14324]KEI36679.1 hypothetical protein L969DRAFT_20070 [Mixia osmundae IAM 14324]GAA96728.1 hypothetical protein E5Q_03399 [Mixia osmundae IAM 14324]